jgi:tetratricopeptide (TPR) repeat protein
MSGEFRELFRTPCSDPQPTLQSPRAFLLMPILNIPLPLQTGEPLLRSAWRSLTGRRWVDGVLLALLAATAFLLGCYEMGDSDIWWHLRGGEWIIEHGRPPRLDPFTFGSADRMWVDVHWSYEVILALAYRAGGAGALVLLGAAVGAAAFVACLTARRRDWPATAAVLSWAPALVLLAFRLDPRPEIFSLLYIGCFLAVLWRVEERPALAWLLPLVQILWVNAQGLFIFGPILLGMFVTAHAARLAWDRWRGRLIWGAEQRRWWRHVGGASCAVVLACLVNPYGLDGALFPFDLFPKVAEANNIYKRYIDELASPAGHVREQTLAVAGANWFFLAFYFLLQLLPLSFLYPCLWRAWGAAASAGERTADSWLGALAAVVGLLALGTLTLSGTGVPPWIVFVGDNVPLLLVMAGAAAALAFRKRSVWAAALVGAGGMALGAWAAWLRVSLAGDGRGLLIAANSEQFWELLLALGGSVALGLVLRWGGNLFRILLATAFVYLALQALQNWTRFALVGGTLLAWNFGEWATELTALCRPGRMRVALGWALRAGLAGGLAAWVAVLLADRYYVHTGEPRHFAFREQPLEFAHDAATFAGRRGMPDRALIYDVGQAGVYVWHNAPRCKPFIDGRFEMPDRQTFETYVKVEQWMADGDPRWESAVAAMGDPLLLLEHQHHYPAEARLLMHPRWRCVYYDALASVFVRRGAAADFPTLDSARRHFRDPAAPPVPAVRGAALREQRALFQLAASLPPTPAAGWRWRVPVLLAGLDLARLALEEEPTSAEAWVLLGGCCWRLDPDLTTPPPAPAETWRLERNLYLAQATYCFRRAAECQADHVPAWRYLSQVYQVRHMVDARVFAEERWRLNDPRAAEADREKARRLREEVAGEPVPSPSESELPAAVARLVQRNRPEAAARLIERAEEDGAARWPWPFAEQAAGLYMHLGRPADARRIWEQASGCPSEALRACRLAATFWVERDYDAAVRHFQAARAADPRLAEACWGLAMLYARLGDAGPALEACRAGGELSCNERQRADLAALEQLLGAY